MSVSEKQQIGLSYFIHETLELGVFQEMSFLIKFSFVGEFQVMSVLIVLYSSKVRQQET